QVDVSGGALQVRFAAAPDAAALPELVRRWRGAALTPSGLLRLPVPPGATPLAVLGDALAALEQRALGGLARAGL
ncbi:MAG TPA: hypothetical protein VFX28_23920, partial [Methylomirabilota bacterium]|nr:hypothetical protein [Methylomirabilota bacterium]